MPGRLISYEYFAAPVAFNGPSMRSMRLPMSARLSAAGQSTFAISRNSFPGRVHHGEHHAGIGAAATKIAAETGADLLDRGVRIFTDESGAGDDEARGAKAALLGVVVHKGLLHFVHSFRRAQPFDARNF